MLSLFLFALVGGAAGAGWHPGMDFGPAGGPPPPPMGGPAGMGMYRGMLYGQDPTMAKIKRDASEADKLAQEVTKILAEPKYKVVMEDMHIRNMTMNVRNNLNMVVIDLKNVLNEIDRALYRHPSMANSSGELAQYDHFNDMTKHSAEELNYVGLVLSLFNQHIGFPSGEPGPMPRFDLPQIRDALMDPSFADHFHAHKAHALVQMLEHAERTVMPSPLGPPVFEADKSLKVAKYLRKMAQRAVTKYEQGVMTMNSECNAYVGLSCQQLLDFVRMYLGDVEKNIEALEKFKRDFESGVGPHHPHHHHPAGAPFPGGPCPGPGCPDPAMGGPVMGPCPGPDCGVMLHPHHPHHPHHRP